MEARGTQPIPIHTLVTHHRPHLDELFAVWLLRNFGERHFPGVSKAKTVYVDAGTPTFLGQPADQLERDGCLMLGVGQGRFDEHRDGESGRQDCECCSTLVAKHLGIDTDPALEKLLRYVLNADSKGAGQPFDLVGVIQAAYADLSENRYELVYNWAAMAFRAKYSQAVKFLGPVADEFQQKAAIRTVRLPDGTTMDIAVIESDSVAMPSYAMSDRGGQVAILVHRQSTGNVQIHPNPRHHISMEEVAVRLRQAEARANGFSLKGDWIDHASAGKIAGAEEWYFQNPPGRLMNGSLTTKNVPPTKLSLDQINDLVEQGLRTAYSDQAPRATFRVCELTAAG